MQSGYADHSLIGHVRKRNTTFFVGARLSLPFSILYFFLFTLGALMTVNRLPLVTHVQQQRVMALTASPFADCVLPRQYVEAILTHGKSDLLFLALLLAAGCTFFAKPVTQLITGLHAFAFGGLISAFISLVKTQTCEKGLFTLCMLFGLCYGILFVSASCHVVMFSYEFRHIGLTRRSYRARSCLNRYLIYMTAYAGALILLHSLQCLMTFLMVR